jgi:hypothetical protein
MLPRNIGQGLNPFVTLVETGEQVKLPATRVEKNLLALDPDLFESLQAIGNETRADDIHAPHALQCIA